VKRAASVMWEAHTKGRAVARSCHEELAELYEGRLRAKGLMFGTEPVG
jgi:ATP-dependent Clp protease adaptor protein ClpS